MDTVELKVCMLGNQFVGKTSIARRFVQNDFKPNQPATFGVDYLVKKMKMDDANYKLFIWDTVGQEKFHALSTMYYRMSHAVLIVYDMTSKHAFDTVEYWYSRVKKFGPENLTIAVAGNKCDLPQHPTFSIAQMEDFCLSIRAIHMETSALTGHNVDAVFHNIVDVLRAKVSPTSRGNGVIKNLKDETGSDESIKSPGWRCCTF